MSDSTVTTLNQTELAMMLAEIVCPCELPPLWRDGTAFIFDGHALFTIDVDQVLGWGAGDPLRLERLKAATTPTDLLPAFELPNIEPHPSWANPREMIEIRCGECHGSGEVTCEYDHEHECPDCKGSGKIKDARIDVEYHSKGSTLSRSIETSAGLFQERYLWMLAQLAQHRRLTFGTSKGGLCFSFEGGAGIVMRLDVRP